MTQSALKKDLQDETELQVSEALLSIRNVIKTNLERGLDELVIPATDKTIVSEMKQEAVIPLGISHLGKVAMSSEKRGDSGDKTSLKIGMPMADVLYLTQVLEDDGSITTLEKKETGMGKKEEEPAKAAASEETVSVEPKVMVDATPEKGAEEAPEKEEKSSKKEEPVDNLASPETMAESAAAFSELANVARQMSEPGVVLQSSGPVTNETAGSYTVEALMRELLRPMLKEWLDAHLPSLVKWLVTEQIEKMLKDNGLEPASSSVEETPADPVVEDTPAETEKTPAEDDAGGDPTADMDFDAPPAAATKEPAA